MLYHLHFPPDGQFGVTTKHGFKIYDELKDKWYLIHGKSVTEKDRWLTAFEQERKRVKQDHASGKQVLANLMTYSD